MFENRVPKIASVAQSIFEAGLGETSWDSAVRDIMAVHNAAGGAFFQLDRNTLDISEWHSVDLNDKQEYIEEMNAINPRMHYSLSQEAPHIITDLDCISKEAMGRHEFYRWLETRCNLQYFIGARLMDVGDKSTFMSVEFEAGETPPSGRFLDEFKAISIHCANAKRPESSRDTEMRATNLDSFLAQKSSTALFFLDNKCRFFFANPSGEALLSKGQLLSLMGGFLSLKHQPSQDKLAAYYQSIQEDGSGQIIKPLAPIFVPSPNPKHRMLIRLMHLPHILKGPGNKWSSICLFVQTASDKYEEIGGLLAETFGLTRREAELALTLQENTTIVEAAAILSIAHNTARVHLQRVFKKTGTSTQADLAVVIERLSSWV